MRRFRVSKTAEHELDAIYLYWAERAGVNVADRIIDGITERFWLLGEHPNSGRAADEIAARVRCFPAGKYLIYYRKNRSTAEILHIFHGARNRKRAYRRSKRQRESG